MQLRGVRLTGRSGSSPPAGLDGGHYCVPLCGVIVMIPRLILDVITLPLRIKLP
jgi:hypothetical protein